MLKERVMTAVVAVVVLSVVLFVVPEPFARGVIAAVFAAAAWEWSGFLGLTAIAPRLVYVALFASLEAGTWLALPDLDLYRTILMVAIAWWVAALVWMLFFPTPIPAAVGWLCGALTLLPAYAAIDWLYLESPLLLLSLLVIVWLADIGAYFAGRAFGRVKLAPAISPGKTWEGVLGGVIAVLIVAVAAGLATERSLAVVVPFCLAVALLSVVGDLTVSMFKRHAGVKDSGTLLPGHGGVLDRIDSVCAAAPLFAAGLAVLGLS